MGVPAVRLTAHARDVVLSVRRQYHFYIYELYFTTAGSQTIKRTVKYTKIHLCGLPDTDSRHAANRRSNTSTLHQLPRHSHQLCLARGN